MASIFRQASYALKTIRGSFYEYEHGKTIPSEGEVTLILYHEPDKEDNRHYCDVEVDGVLRFRLFDPDYLRF